MLPSQNELTQFQRFITIQEKTGFETIDMTLVKSFCTNEESDRISFNFKDGTNGLYLQFESKKDLMNAHNKLTSLLNSHQITFSD